MIQLNKTGVRERRVTTVVVDDKGRVRLPSHIRDRLCIEAGDSFFIQEEDDNTIRIGKAVNPFDALAEHAIGERESGRTKSLRERWGEELTEDDSE